MIRYLNILTYLNKSRKTALFYDVCVDYLPRPLY